MSLGLSFTKMHALGNDFVLIDGVRHHVVLDAQHIAQLGDRHTGIGFDQLLVVIPPEKPTHDFGCLIYNSDGNRAGHCGNGIRCFARFVKDCGLSARTLLHIGIGQRTVTTNHLGDNRYEVDMGFPSFKWDSLPFHPAGIEESGKGGFGM